MSTATWNPERRFPWLGDSLPCPTPEEALAEREQSDEQSVDGFPRPMVRQPKLLLLPAPRAPVFAATPEEEAAEDDE